MLRTFQTLGDPFDAPTRCAEPGCTARVRMAVPQSLLDILVHRCQAWARYHRKTGNGSESAASETYGMTLARSHATESQDARHGHGTSCWTARAMLTHTLGCRCTKFVVPSSGSTSHVGASVSASVDPCAAEPSSPAHLRQLALLAPWGPAYVVRPVTWHWQEPIHRTILAHRTWIATVVAASSARSRP